MILKIECTSQEGQNLLAVIDRACRAGGLEVADACVIWMKKVLAAEEAVKLAEEWRLAEDAAGRPDPRNS